MVGNGGCFCRKICYNPVILFEGETDLKLSRLVFPPDGASRGTLRAHRAYLAVLLTLLGVGIGFLGLWLTACADAALPQAELYRSYLDHPLLLALNLFPPLLLAWLGYFLSGRCWCGVLLSGLFGVGLPLINYYKVMLRGDPMRASDILLLRTAGGILYKATRRKVKNLNIRVHPDGTVAVSIPFRSSWEEADRFVLRHRDWVQEAQRDLADREARTYWRPLPEKDVALAHFAAMSDKVYPAFAEVLGGQKPILKVRSMTSRWGVCTPGKRQITLALELYNMPEAAQIYVVVHEYCHFLVLDHSPKFWAEVEKILPDWKARRELLK